ncbi:MAG: hypothetical protein NTY48_06725 [Candidatus Diapherotrites archaeon]|nr:hypothetical protein [Candidatus Diapherotrites archaeon]
MALAKAVLHYPRLDTVIMIEDAIKGADKYISKNELWRTLPKQVQYQTFKYIIDYLEDLGKIMVCSDGKLIWTWNPVLVKKVLNNQKLIVRSKS